MDNPSTPLADYFWIAGVDSISYNDTPLPQSPKKQQSLTQLDPAIAEDGEPPELDSDARLGNVNNAQRVEAQHSKHKRNRPSKSSGDSRSSIRTVEELDVTKSNRSSATIQANLHHHSKNYNSSSITPPASPVGLHVLNAEGMPPGFDFDQALYKYAAERETFLDDLTFSSGAKVQSRPPMVSPRAERIKADEDVSLMRNPIRSIKGSLRRKMTFRDMNSMKRQPIAARSGIFPEANIKLLHKLTTQAAQPRYGLLGLSND